MTFIAEFSDAPHRPVWIDCDAIREFYVLPRTLVEPTKLAARLADGNDRVIYEHPNGLDISEAEVAAMQYMCRCIMLAIQQDKAYIGDLQLRDFWQACLADEPIPQAINRAWPTVPDRPGMLEWRPAQWVTWDAVMEVQGIEQELRVRLVARDSFTTLYRFSNDFKAELAVAWFMDHWGTYMPMRLQAEVCHNIEYNATVPAAPVRPTTEPLRRLSIPETAASE